MKRTPLSLLNEALPGEWGAQMGFKPTPDFFGTQALTEIVDLRKTGMQQRIDALADDPWLDTALFDHAVKFRRLRGSRSIAAVVTSPYLRTLLSHFHDSATANARVYEIAAECGLAVRVGHFSDVVYVAGPGPDSTLPIVWWDPTKVSLPLPEFDDPRVRFADRLSD